MNPAPITLFPVIMPVSQADQALKGREKVVRLSRLARAALQRSCQISNLALSELPKDGDGVPLPVGGVYWSLSHKTEIVGGVAATQPVGLDLETVRPINQAIMDRVADADEWCLVNGGRSQENFFRFWTAKEAVLKATGKGFVGISRCRIMEIVNRQNMLLTFDGHPWPVTHLRFGDHLAAITARHFSVEWR